MKWVVLSLAMFLIGAFAISTNSILIMTLSTGVMVLSIIPALVGLSFILLNNVETIKDLK